MIDYTLSHPSIEELGEGHVLTRTRINEWARLIPLEKDPYVSPLFATDLSGLPPAVVITAGFDLMRDEGKAYADRLVEDGVKTLYKEFTTEGHGFMAADATKSVRTTTPRLQRCSSN